MKNLAKFFVAVAALFVGVSCTTDTTEDLGQQIVGKGQTVLTVSTGESVLDTKTSLGGKVDGTYPIYWSNGDKLSLNGKASAPLADVEANSTSATFTWEGTFDAPFCVAYPASDEGTVTFAAEQSYVEGTFSQNAVPMIGYSDEVGVSGVQLQYLAGVLQFNVSGAATLASMIIETVDGTPIAGVFDCDFATGTVKPQAGSRSSIEYSFGEAGLDISGGKSFHVAVPAGKYDAVKVIMLNAEGGAFEGTIQADGTVKPELAAGQVREFTISNWTANRTYTVIKDAQTLEQFAASAEDVEIAVVLKDVDASSLTDWAPIEGFTGLLRGNGKTISGLTQAMFGTLSGTVTNLTLESTIAIGNAASATDTTNNHYGVFAKEANGASFFSCTAKGGDVQTFQVSNAVYKNVGNAKDEMAFGGLVGYAENTTFKGCTNSVLFQVKRPCVDDHSNTTPKNRYPSPSFGGIVGYAKGCTIENCANVAKEFDWYLSGNKDYIYGVNYGGIVGAIVAGADASNPGIVTNCTNSAYLRFRGGTRIASIGGVVGYTSVNVTHCENTAAFTMGSGGFRYCRGFGGVVGYVTDGADLLYLVNRGKITVNIPYTKMILGGIVGLGDSDSKVACCENYGEIDVQGSRVAVAVSYAQMRIGGIAGQFNGTVTQNTNYDTGNITVKAKGVLPRTAEGATNTVPLTCIGGVVGSKSSSGLTENENYGAITFSTVSNLKPDSNNKDTDLGDISPYIGGVAGFASSIPSSCSNAGKIMVTDSLTCAGIKVGGIIAMCTSASEFANSKNSGDIEVSAILGKDAYIGGITAWANECADECLNNDNSGDITFTGVAPIVWVGGIVGRKDLHLSDGSRLQGLFNNCDNTGKITVTATEDSRITGYSVGGVAGSFAANMTSCTNNGAINVNVKAKKPVFSAELIHIPHKVGGIAGACLGKLTTCKNLENGDITVSGSIYPEINASKLTDVPENVLTGWPASSLESEGVTKNHGNAVGGLAGCCQGANIYGCENKGDINQDVDILAFEGYTITYGIFTGGLIGYTGQNMTSSSKSTNSGHITVSGDQSVSSGYFHVAGGIARTGKGGSKNIYNEGNITINAKGSTICVGGVFSFGAADSKAWSDCHNSGNITISKDAEATTDLYIGGVIAKGAASSWTSCSNSGNFTVEKGASIAKKCIIGGITSNGNANLVIDSCTNEGNIEVQTTITGNYTVIGGIQGYMDAVTADKEHLKGCLNTGNITVSGTDMHSVFAGGITGSQGSKVIIATGLTNEGTISFTGSAKKAYIGGIAGSITQSVANYSNIKSTGKVIATGSLTDTGDYMVGGLAGRAATAMNGWEVNATVSAPVAATCGIVVGAPRSYGTANGCYVQGKISREGEAEVTLDASNFTDYIYSDAYNAADACVFGPKPAQE